MNRQSGFTLLEVVIALFIFAILAITVSFGFHQIITINNRVQQQMRRWNRVVLAISMMQSDLNQMIKRPVQNGDGQQMPYFVNNTTAIKFTTDTFSPLNAKGHSDLERVSYVYSDGSLNKITWPVLDRARQTKQLSKTLLNGLDFVKFKVYSQSNAAQTLPRAVEVDMDVKYIGSIKRIFMVTGNMK